jgi:hypothetical protein
MCEDFDDAKLKVEEEEIIIL